MQVREDFKYIANPYNEDEKVVAIPPITPKVALFHGYQADRDGNVIADASQNNKLLAQATRGDVIATVEQVVEKLEWNSGRMYIPGHYITCIVHSPGGAHPTYCPGFYKIDSDHMKYYLKAAARQETWQKYLQKYIYNPSQPKKYGDLVDWEKIREGAEK